MTDGVEDTRSESLVCPPRLPAGRALSIDETGSTVALARDHAGAPRGERVNDDVPRDYGDAIPVIGALTTTRLRAVRAVFGGTTKGACWAYVEAVFAPELRAGDVVVWDNPAAHKDERVRDRIAAKGARQDLPAPPTRRTSTRSSPPGPG